MFSKIYITIICFVGFLKVDCTEEPKSNFNKNALPLILHIPKKDINRAIYFSKNVLNMMELREELLDYAEVTVEKGSPSHGQFIAFAPLMEAQKQEKDALIATHATSLLIYEFCKNKTEECVKAIKHYNLELTPLHKTCKKFNQECTKEDIFSKYRSIDGSCNNIINGVRGKSFTVYKRILPPRYLDGIKEPRRSVTKRPLPSSRLVSVKVFEDMPVLKKLTAAVNIWTQFVEHDLAHTAMTKAVHTGKPIECCRNDGGTNNPRYLHPYCFPVEIFFEDDYYSRKDVSCLSYVRSIPGINSDCMFGPMQQLNQATHFLDASQIYGPLERITYNLRTLNNGKLAVHKVEDIELLPLSKQPKDDCQNFLNNTLCFQSGDSRVNLDTEISAFYTLWVREHNRIAEHLAALNPDADDEILFQEARRIVIAEMQHITYDEWLPIVLGPFNPQNFADNLVFSSEISNEFATAAIRALQLISFSNNSSMEDEEIEKEQTSFKTPIDFKNILNKIISNEKTGSPLRYYGELFDKKYGYDILTMDIQRSRDHGIPSYNDLRNECKLKKANTFDDFLDTMTAKTVEDLKSVYKHPDDVDLIVGGLAEIPQGGVVGPTLSCILWDQFKRTKLRDRYFYSNTEQPYPLSDSQLKEINKVTLASIFCHNGYKIESMPLNVFQEISDINPMVPCDKLPKLNLALWTSKRDIYF